MTSAVLERNVQVVKDYVCSKQRRAGFVGLMIIRTVALRGGLQRHRGVVSCIHPAAVEYCLSNIQCKASALQFAPHSGCRISEQ